MRASFTGILICLTLTGLITSSCQLASDLAQAIEARHQDQDRPPMDSGEAAFQQAEIERIVQTGLAQATLVAPVTLVTPTPLAAEDALAVQAALVAPATLVAPTPLAVQATLVAPATLAALAEPASPSLQVSSAPPNNPPELLPSPTLAPTLPSPAAPSDVPISASPAALLPALLPGSAHLSGFTHLYQNMNNCGPAALAMTLSYWDWPGDLRDYIREGRQRDLQLFIAQGLKPEPQDKNVAPYELAAFVQQTTPFKALVRAAGDLETLQRFTAAGFPVIVQRGLDAYVWMGHYQVVSGYDDARQLFYLYDSYLGPSTAIATPYHELLQDWRAFNFTYLVVYPPDREGEVASILGSHFDPDDNLIFAAKLARDELPYLTGRDLFFGWYNLGTSLVELEQYPAAAEAFDRAFAIYDELPEAGKPWRMLWYQTSPYPAYYHTARYADLETLASRTMEGAYEPAKPQGPFIEESFYWRGMALAAQGLTFEARADFIQALELNPLFTAPAEELNRLRDD
jgi:tetratricopeptide (TPR) repeat protein